MYPASHNRIMILPWPLSIRSHSAEASGITVSTMPDPRARPHPISTSCPTSKLARSRLEECSESCDARTVLDCRFLWLVGTTAGHEFSLTRCPVARPCGCATGHRDKDKAVTRRLVGPSPKSFVSSRIDSPIRPTNPSVAVSEITAQPAVNAMSSAAPSMTVLPIPLAPVNIVRRPGAPDPMPNP